MSDEMKYAIVTDQKGLETACQYFSNKKVLGLDLETTSLDPQDGRIRLIQISDGDKIVIIDMFKFKDFDVEPLKFLLTSPATKIVIHNSKFEQKWFLHHFKFEVTKVFDTFIASQLIDYNGDNDPKRKHNLGAVGRRILKIDLDKTEQASDWGREELTQAQYEYAALDVYYLPKLREMMYAMLEADKQLYTAVIDFECVPAIAQAELNGINVNRKIYEEEIHVLEALRDRAGKTLQAVLRPTTRIDTIQERFFGMKEINYGDVLLTSSSQMLTALKALGVPCVAASDEDAIKAYEKAKKPFAIGTGEKALSPLERDYPVVKLLMDFRGVEKMVSAFGYNVLNMLRPSPTGERVHPTFFVNGAETGRMSAKNPNSMQVPNGEVEVGDEKHSIEFRKAFTFPEGRAGVIADYSGIELRIAGEFSKDPVFIEAFDTNLDLHALTASLIFSLPYETCSDKTHDHYHKYRAFAKRINFGILYGIGAWGLSALLKNDVEECKEMLQAHRDGHQILWQYLDSQKFRAKTTLRARTASGRLIRFNAPEKDENGQPNWQQLSAIARVGTNQPIQGTSADIIKIALKLVHNRIKGLDAMIVNIVHDEIMMECAESIAPQIKEILESSMKEAGEIFLKRVPCVVEASIIKSWGEK